MTKSGDGFTDADHCPQAGCGLRITDSGVEGRELPNGQRWCHAHHADRLEMMIELLIRAGYDGDEAYEGKGLDVLWSMHETIGDLGPAEALHCALQEANLLDVDGGPDDEIRLRGD